MSFYYKQVFAQVDEVFPLLLKVLTNESDEVVIADLDVLAEVAGTAVPAGKPHVCYILGLCLILRSVYYTSLY